MMKSTAQFAALAIFATGSLAGAPGSMPEPATIAATQPVSLVTEPSANIEQLVPFSIDYKISFSGLGGIASLALKRGKMPNEYEYRVESQAKGLAKILQSGAATESSLFAMTAAGMRPSRYDYDEGTGKVQDNSTVRFNWAARSADSIHEGEPATLNLSPDVRDRLSADLETILELRAGETPDTQVIAYRNSIRRYDLYPRGEETIETPAGTYETVKYLRQREGSKRSTMIWFAIDAGYLPVRIAQMKNNKINVTMEAVSINLPAR
jgi:hypothetical protein